MAAEDEQTPDADIAERENGAERATSSADHAERIERDRERLLAALAAGQSKLVVQQVAWILNTRPETRDSDVELQLAYWREFEPELYAEFCDGDAIAAYKKLTRQTSLSREREDSKRLSAFSSEPEDSRTARAA
jgi:hypothetical protein